ncbi:MAG: CarD family transcriptional regulator [Actinobacteria bacterium]|nr:CarD family transcriptional regulator [Actinomycetota bacterium]
MFSVGDKVVYPHHGAGRILDICQREVQGETRQYMTIQILHNDMTVMVPVDAAERAGIRAVIDEVMVEEVVGVLREDPTLMPKNWNRRLKHNREKIKSGDIFELADVVRNLAIRDATKGLSTGEKQMFGRVKKILASELMYAKKIPEAEAVQYLESLLTEICERAECE